MTHTPGFEEAIRNLFVPDAAAMMPLRDYVIGHLPNSDFRARHRAGVLELRDGTRRLHRAARGGHAVRGLRRRAHLQAAGDDAAPHSGSRCPGTCSR